MKKKIFIAGHNGMVGSALYSRLNQEKDVQIIVANKEDLNLIKQEDVDNFFSYHNPDEVYIAAARVGGINANNKFPANFIYENLMIQTNLIHASYKNNVKKLLFLGSSCIYPKFASQPMKESELLTGALELTNEPYAIAKIAGIKMCESYNRQFNTDFRSVMPTNLYGPGDNYNPDNSHVIPGLIFRFHKAKLNKEPEIVIWGSGNQKREFLHVDDLAQACFHIMKLSKNEYDSLVQPMQTHINIGFGEDISIRDLSLKISRIIKFKGEIIFDKSKPDGPSKKLLDSSLINSTGWFPIIKLKEGLETTYNDFIKNNKKNRNNKDMTL